MAKFEMTLTCERWMTKGSEPAEGPIVQALNDLKVPAAPSATTIDEIRIDSDEIDWTDLQARWRVEVFCEYECVDGEENAVGAAAEAAVRALGFPTVACELDAQDYTMGPEEVVRLFTSDVRPNLVHTDRIALHEAFEGHIDSLQKQGMITEWQREQMDNPFAVPMG